LRGSALACGDCSTRSESPAIRYLRVRHSGAGGTGDGADVGQRRALLSRARGFQIYVDMC
jgi:hypothetical protein